MGRRGGDALVHTVVMGMVLLAGRLVGMGQTQQVDYVAQVADAAQVNGGGLPAVAQGKMAEDSALSRQIEGLLSDPAVARAHWGVIVAGMDGRVIYGLNEGQLFQPASNAKLFTTAAAMALLGGETTFETRVERRGAMDAAGTLTGNLAIVGQGDANLSGRELPYVEPADRPKPVKGAPPLAPPDPLRYLAAMADHIAASGLKRIEGDVVGDDRWFPWEPYPQDWSIDDAVWGYGAPVSALTVNDNLIVVTVSPGPEPLMQAVVTLEPDLPYYTLGTQVAMVAGNGPSLVTLERLPGTKLLQIYGTMPRKAEPDVSEAAMEDPPEFAAMALKGMLEARGIVVTGRARADHRERTKNARNFGEWQKQVSDRMAEALRAGAPAPVCPAEATGGEERTVVARRVSVRLAEDVVVTNKVSQNLHAELMLHDLAKRYACNGYTAEGVGVLRGWLTAKVGIDPEDFVFFDGSGLSGHDLVTPRATVRLLQYAAGEPWFADWKRSLPVGGVDGSLLHRFTKAPLKGHVFAKTGTLGEARALSGYLECASGKTVAFSIMVGNHAPGTSADREAMDKIVAAIAELN